MTASKQQIKAELLRHVNDETSYSSDFDNIGDAINHHVDELYNDIDDFYEIEQSDIDDQNADYDESYLDGAVGGDLVWCGESEVFLSLLGVEDHLRDASERMSSCYNHVDYIVQYVKYFLVVEALEHANN